MTMSVKDLVPRAPVGSLEPHSGDRMSREEFHRIYEQMPEDVKAELVGAIVFVASPLRIRHAASQPALTTAMFLYAINTPGVEVGDNTTALFSEDGEPQPDPYMRILPEYGGQSRASPQDHVARTTRRDLTFHPLSGLESEEAGIRAPRGARVHRLDVDG